MQKEIMTQIGEAWSHRPKRLPRTRWWESAAIMRHVSKKILEDEQNNEFFGKVALERLGRTFDKGISVGCGRAGNELALLKAGMVNHFDFYELSPQSIMDAKKDAEKLGIRNQCTFHYGDFLNSKAIRPESYDLVYWSGSLHHMLDVRKSVNASFDMLKADGYFYCFEYVGANHFQHPALEIMVANGARMVLPKQAFAIPGTNQEWPMDTGRPKLDTLLASDPSEAADSENIIPAIESRFPHAKIIKLGGVIYNFALEDILTNIPDDCPLLQDLLKIDDDAAEHGMNHYAFTLVRKTQNSQSDLTIFFQTVV